MASFLQCAVPAAGNHTLCFLASFEGGQGGGTRLWSLTEALLDWPSPHGNQTERLYSYPLKFCGCLPWIAPSTQHRMNTNSDTWSEGPIGGQFRARLPHPLRLYVRTRDYICRAAWDSCVICRTWAPTSGWGGGQWSRGNPPRSATDSKAQELQKIFFLFITTGNTQETGEITKWPGGLVPYQFSSNLEGERLLLYKVLHRCWPILWLHQEL